MSSAEPGFRAIPQRRVFEDVVFQIEQAILDGRLALGDRLPSERELAATFQVSRPSVREALRVLEGFGLIRAKRGTGADSGLIVSATDSGFANLLRLYVSLLRIPLDDLLEIRLVIETWTADAAAKRATHEGIEELTGVIDNMKGALEPEDFLQHDTEFHLTIARISGNAVAPLVMAALREAIAKRMLDAFHSVEDWPRERAMLIEDHSGIVEKIKSGNGDEAAKVIAKHITDFYDRAFRRSTA